MIRFVRYTSIAANLAFVVFLGLLIKNAAKTLRWVYHVNQFWFFLIAIAIILLAALWVEWSEHRKAKAAEAKAAAEAGSQKSELLSAAPQSE